MVIAFIFQILNYRFILIFSLKHFPSQVILTAKVVQLQKPVLSLPLPLPQATTNLTIFCHRIVFKNFPVWQWLLLQLLLDNSCLSVLPFPLVLKPAYQAVPEVKVFFFIFLRCEQSCDRSFFKFNFNFKQFSFSLSGVCLQMNAHPCNVQKSRRRRPRRKSSLKIQTLKSRVLDQVSKFAH